MPAMLERDQFEAFGKGWPPLPVVRCRGYELSGDQEQPFDGGRHLEAGSLPAADRVDSENAAADREGEQ